MKIITLILGLLITANTIHGFQITPEQKKLYQIRLSMPFGDMKSDQEIYFFSDWESPTTAEVEPLFEKLAREFSKTARVYFIDIPNENKAELTNANLGFLINTEKKMEDYFIFRKTLLAGKATTTLLPADFLQGGKLVNKATVKNMNITQAPTVLFYNLKTRETKKIEGLPAIQDL